MAGLARIVVPDVPHHATQRGNRRQEVFFGEEGYAAYRTLIAESCAREGKGLEALTGRVLTRRKPGPKPNGIEYRVPGIPGFRLPNGQTLGLNETCHYH